MGASLSELHRPHCGQGMLYGDGHRYFDSAVGQVRGVHRWPTWVLEHRAFN